jgi:hypothetical protein
MKCILSPPRRVAATLALLLPLAAALPAASVFRDSCTNFTLGNQWQAYGAGAPDLVVGVVGGPGADGSVLRMGCSPGTGEETVGIQTATSFPIAGARLVRVTARLRPLNQTSAGGGGASDASAGIAVIGASGVFARAAASANRPSSPTWANFYVDSDGSANASSVSYVQFPPNDPAGGGEAFRTFVLELRTNGTTLTTLSSTGQPLAVSPFNVVNPNLNLAAFSNSVTIALFQHRADSTSAAPENSFGDVDSVTVEMEGEAVVLLDDKFEPPGAGPGANWEAAGTGLPNVVSDRIDLDGAHLGLRLGTSDTNGSAYGVRLVSPLVVPTDATGLEIDFLVQPRNGGAFDARLLLEDMGDSDSLAVSFNEFFPSGGTRRFATLGSGGGSAFNRTSGDYAFGPGTFYHVLISVRSAGTTVQFKSEDRNTLLHTFVVPELTLSNLLGSRVRLSILQADREHTYDYIGSPECLADRLTATVLTAPPAPLVLTVGRGGNIVNDAKPSGVLHNGVNLGSVWAPFNTDSGSTTRTGAMSFSAAATNQITLAGAPDFNSTQGTILFWMRSAGTTGSGNEGAMLFDRLPSDTNGPPGAVIVQTDAGQVLFQAVSGAGIAGLPNEVSARINLDGSHLGYRMRANDLSGSVFGIQLATPLAIAAAETRVELDLLVQNRGGGAYPARLVLSGLGGSKSLTASLNEFPGSPGGPVRQFVVFGSGGGGTFNLASPEYAQSAYNFYQVRVSIDAAGATVVLTSEDQSTVLQTFSVPALTIADLAGSDLQVTILQAANSAGATEALLDNLTVTTAIGGALLTDSFEPPAAGPGPNWVAARASGVASQFQSVRALNDNRWHQVALVYDQSAAGTSSLFIDGVLDSSQTNNAAWAWGTLRQIELGRSHDANWRAYDGVLDDFRLYNRGLTATEIAQAVAPGAVVDSAALMVWFSFDAPPSGLTLTWPGSGALESTMDITSPVSWNPVPSSSSPFFIRPDAAPLKFYRVVEH